MNSAVMSISFTMVVMLTFMRMATAHSLVKEDYYKSKRGLTPGIAGYGQVSPGTPAVLPYTAAGASAVSVPLTPVPPYTAAASAVSVPLTPVPPYTAAGASAVSVPLTPAAAPLPSLDSFYTAAIRPVYLTAYTPAVASPYAPAGFASAVASTYVPAAPSYVPTAPAAYDPAAAKAPLGFSIYG